jgi:hypothetical protein
MTRKQRKSIEAFYYRTLIRNGIAPKFSFLHSKYKDDSAELIQTIVTKDDKPVAVFDRVYIEPDGHVLNYELMFA